MRRIPEEWIIPGRTPRFFGVRMTAKKVEADGRIRMLDHPDLAELVLSTNGASPHKNG